MKSLNLSPALVRAARALLDWQQADLAKAAGLSLTAIKNFERNSGTTRERTVLTMKNALEAHGVEFPVSGGVRHIEDIAAVVRFSGNDFIRKWNEDIYAAVTSSNEDILTSSTDESLWRLPTVREANDEYKAWCNRRGLLWRHKFLIPEGHGVLPFPRKTYRHLSPKLIGKITYSLYADRLAFILWKKKQVVVLRNAAVVKTFRSQFAWLWRLARPLDES